MSIGRCAASWAASSATRAPCRCAMRAIPSIGHTHLARHVRGPRHRDERVASAQRAQLRLQRVERMRGTRRDGQVAHVAAPPWQEVRVVLARERQHRRAGRQRAGQEVERVGRVAREQHEIVLARSDEAARHLTRPRVRLGAHQRGVSGSPVHAAVVGQQLRDRVGDLPQRRRGRRVVEIRIGHPTRPRRAGPADHHRRAPAGCRQRRCWRASALRTCEPLCLPTSERARSGRRPPEGRTLEGRRGAPTDELPYPATTW